MLKDFFLDATLNYLSSTNVTMKYQENDRTELKSIINESLKKEIVAFLNTHGGTIYVGVNDDGSLNPTFDSKTQDVNLTIISNWINDKTIYPDCRNLISFHYNDDGVMVISVSEGKEKPYYLSDKGMTYGGCFKRVGRSKFHMDNDEIYLMCIESNHILFEEQVSKEQNLTFSRFKDRVVSLKIDWSDDKFNTLGFKNYEGKYTNLGLLFSDQNPIVIKLAVYKGKDRTEFKVKKEFEGSLAIILELLIDYCKICNDKTIIKPEDGDFRRKEIISYPERALREGTLNAIEHANYFFRSNIKVEFFEDRLEILNPGNFYGGITLEQAKHGVQSFRNPKLVYVLDKLKFIENYATGVETIFKSYEKEEVKPSFDITETHTSLILPNLIYACEIKKSTINTLDFRDVHDNVHDVHDNVHDVHDNVHDVHEYVHDVSLLDDTTKIINAIKINPEISLNELAKYIGKSKKTVQRVIKGSGQVIRIGGEKGGYWEIVKKTDG